jgi:arabinan endo-1,5-alpha-L-arabinosidase
MAHAFTPRALAVAVAAALALAGCGGGGGGGSTAAATPAAATPSAPATTTTTTTTTTATTTTTDTPAQAAISFANVSVHDPAVIKVGDTWYAFGSHLAAAKTTDLMNWTKIADGVNDTNPLFSKVTTALADTFAWAQVTDLWAPDVIQLDDGKFYMYYDACKGDSPRSALGVAVADKIEGPYVNKQVFLKSGMWGEVSPDGTVYDALKHPNVVDPNTFRDAAGKLWMIYGSYSGGIFIMAMDPATGLPVAGQGYGKHLMGGNHARIEGAYVMYSPATKYYYLFTSFGGLDSTGGYNMRVARSTSPDGPYLDASGKDMADVKADPTKPLFDDASIAPYGQKLVGNYQFALADGETGTQIGYVSPGHNSARYEAATNQYFLIFHTRFPGQHEYHEVRVHEMFINDDGWPVAAPLRYVPLAKSATTISATVTSADAAGAYKMVNHGKDISATIKPSQAIRLESAGTVTGTASGTWTHKGNNNVALVIDGVTYSGVLSRQWNPNANAFAVTFTAQSKTGVSLWGIRTGS